MADEPKLTQDLHLPPGVVVTPDYEVPEARPKLTHSDRKIDHTGAVVNPAESEFGSTYGQAQDEDQPDQGDTEQGTAGQAPRRLSRSAPDRKDELPAPSAE